MKIPFARLSTVSISLLLLVVSMGSCATPPSTGVSYSPPEPLIVENERFSDLVFDAAWDQIVEDLATKFYVINNIDKQSRIINVSFSSTSPDLYVTGGMTTRSIGEGGSERLTSYDPASSSTYETAWTWGTYNNLPATGTVYRNVTLEGRANIYLAPSGAGTKITVNVRYLLDGKVTGTYVAKNAFGGAGTTGAMQPSSFTASFSTNEPYRVNWGSAAEPSWIVFRSTGKFESEVLSILEK